MYLLGRENGEVKVYLLQAKDEQVRAYREKLITQQYKQNTLFYRINPTSFSRDIELILRGVDLRSGGTTWSYSNLEKVSNSIIPDSISSGNNDGYFSEKELIHEALIRKYINGELSKLKVTRINPPYLKDPLQYGSFNLVAPTTMKKLKGSYGSQPSFYIENLMNLPQQLANLSFLEQEKFNFIYYDCIDEQLKLFDIEQVDTSTIRDVSSLKVLESDNQLIGLVKQLKRY